MHAYPVCEFTWRYIAHRPLTCLNDSYKASSLKGRGICVVHLFATPLKGLAGGGKLLIEIIQIPEHLIAIVTLNSRFKSSIKVIGHNLGDVVLGGVLLPVALLANIFRSAVGLTIHPGAMIKHLGLNGGVPAGYRYDVYKFNL